MNSAKWLASKNRNANYLSPTNTEEMEAAGYLDQAEKEALQFILGLSDDYPNIDEWYLRKVVPGLRLGTRFLLPIRRNDELVGLGIAKNDGLERKICTVRVAPKYFGRGVGPRIFDGLLKWLDDDRPNLTVSSTKLPAFERIFDWYGFKFSGAETGLYVPGRDELGYNGALLPAAPVRSPAVDHVNDPKAASKSAA